MDIRYAITGLAILLSLLSSTPALALRCGTQLIQEGDIAPEVRSLCGEPEHIERWQEDGYGVWRRYDDREDGRYRYRRPHRGLIQVERWTYNPGPGKFLRYLRFENGTLVEIATGELRGR